MTDTQVIDSSKDNEKDTAQGSSIRLSTFGGVISEKAEKAVDSIQRRDFRLRIYNAFTAMFFCYIWLLYYRAKKMLNMNTVTWVDFFVLILFVMACVGFAANSHKHGRSFKGYQIFPYVVVILMPVTVYLATFLPVLGGALQQSGFKGAWNLAAGRSAGLYANLDFIFYVSVLGSIIFSVLSLIELLTIRKLFVSLRREHYRMVRLIDESKLLKIVRFFGVLNLLYLTGMIAYYYYYAFTTRGYNYWVMGIMTIVFAIVFFNMLSNVRVMLKYDTYNTRTGPFLFVFGISVVLMFFTRANGLPLTAGAGGELLPISLFGMVYFLYLSIGVFISLMGSFFTKA